ncbi:hypothetical protein [Salinirubrum litoreum]|uniref:DUF8149 domain-containing protein n=1 Tax=Salinirubrum litoreum TaxID=1126234 RepID=A0ABD5RFX0_9EURY|nr:hypothetical protein [Salinirubrum litoreum]
MSDDEPRVPIVCTDCGTDARIPLDDVADKLDAHNDRHHDGEEVATVDPDLADQLANLVVEDMGLLDEE